jgi:DNA polymerase/3'-5' exonuclease PolX
MSSGTAIPLKNARAVAVELLDRLMPACERGAIAGSIRRQRPEVNDIELVVVPSFQERVGEDLWGTPHEADLLTERLGWMVVAGEIRPRVIEVHRSDGTIEQSHRDGDSYKALEYRGLPVDLFVVRPPADWGVIVTIRTGPADWSHRLVTDCQRYLRCVAGGRLYRSGQYVPCHEELDFFRGIGQEWVEPWERSAERVLIQPRVAA